MSDESSRKLIRNSTAEFLIFTAQEGEDQIEVRYEAGTIWLTQPRIATLLGTTRENVVQHLGNIFAEGELIEASTRKDFLRVRQEGTRNVQRHVAHYNLDAIISVGYRVNSVRATQFRQWATNVLREFAIRGYVLDRKRLENGSFLGEDYFERLLEEIREIRLSERRFYQKVTDIYATSVDYNPDAPTTRSFFASVQNKLHFAIHGRTAAELIADRANSDQPNMELTSWENAPDGRILRTDVTVGKNYLTKDELADLGRLVNAFLDLAENRARRQILMSMEDWSRRLDDFLRFDDREVLAGPGSISKPQADQAALDEFEKFRLVQERRFVSDFDRFAASMLNEVAATADDQTDD